MFLKLKVVFIGHSSFHGYRAVNIWKTHHAIHDAESLIYVLLFLCTHLSAPNELSKPTLLGSRSNHPLGISTWLSANNMSGLGHTKFSQMTAHFEHSILPHLSLYFKPLGPPIWELWKALFPSMDMQNVDASHSVVTLCNFINIFKTVLSDKDLIARAKEPDNHLKHPGELVISENGWDARPAPKKQMMVTTMKPKWHTRSVVKKQNMKSSSTCHCFYRFFFAHLFFLAFHL